MINRQEDTINKRNELHETARGMIAGNVDLIDGCRRICVLRIELELWDDESIDIIRGFESETECYPTNERRQYFNPQYLSQLDLQMKSYLDTNRQTIIEACMQILEEGRLHLPIQELAEQLKNEF